MIRLLSAIFAVCLICQTSFAQTDGSDSIKIGVVYGFTGIAQVWSDFGRKGLELAQEEINQSGGIKGRKVELIFEDSKSIPAQSVSAYRKLVTSNGAKVVIGDVFSFLTNPLIPLAMRDKVVLLSPTTMPESAEQVNDYFFSMGERVESTRKAVELFFKNNTGVKRVGILFRDDMWGRAYERMWKEAAESNGATVQLTIGVTDAASDFRTDIAKMKIAHVDAIIISTFGEVILQRLKELHFSPKVLTTGNVAEDIKVRKAPKELFEGIFVTDWKPSNEFTERFRAKFHIEPVVEAHNSYEALRSIAKGLMSNELELVNGLREVNYEGVAGLVDFSRGSFVNYSTAKLYQVHDGEFAEIH